MAFTDLKDEIFNIWVIGRKNGVCIFAQEFAPLPDTKINEDLASGFFSAIHMFSEEITKQTIRYMELEDLCFHFHVMEKVYFVLVSSIDADRTDVNFLFESLQERFETRFHDLLEADKFYDVGAFSDFAVEVEEEVGKKSKIQMLFNQPAEFVKQRYAEAKQQLSAMKKTLMDTAMGIVDKQMGLVKRALRGKLDREQD
jgi:hypothetical protein